MSFLPSAEGGEELVASSASPSACVGLILLMRAVACAGACSCCRSPCASDKVTIAHPGVREIYAPLGSGALRL